MPRTITVVVDENTNQVIYPEGYVLTRAFTAAQRPTTAPAVATELGYETDTGLFYRATGTGAGNWVAVTAAGLTLEMSGDSYVAVMDGETQIGRIQLIIP